MATMSANTTEQKPKSRMSKLFSRLSVSKPKPSNPDANAEAAINDAVNFGSGSSGVPSKGAIGAVGGGNVVSRGNNAANGDTNNNVKPRSVKFMEGDNPVAKSGPRNVQGGTTRNDDKDGEEEEDEEEYDDEEDETEEGVLFLVSWCWFLWVLIIFAFLALCRFCCGGTRRR
jgi:hypothetical protein